MPTVSQLLKILLYIISDADRLTWILKHIVFIIWGKIAVKCLSSKSCPPHLNCVQVDKDLLVC